MSTGLNAPRASIHPQLMGNGFRVAHLAAETRNDREYHAGGENGMFADSKRRFVVAIFFHGVSTEAPSLYRRARQREPANARHILKF